MNYTLLILLSLFLDWILDHIKNIGFDLFKPDFNNGDSDSDEGGQY